MKPKVFYLMLIAVTMVLIAAGGVGYYFGRQRLQSQIKSLSTKLADINLADEKINQLLILSRQYKQAEPNLNRVETALPKSKKQSQLVLQLQQLALQNGMNIGAVTFNNTAGLPTATTQTIPEGDALAMPVTFQVSGSYPQLHSFLVGLEKLNRYDSVTSLGIGSADGNKSRFDIQLNAYLKP